MASNNSYPEIFTWVKECIKHLPSPELIQKLTIDITNGYMDDLSANTEDILPKLSDYAMLSQFLEHLCVSRRLGSIVLWITVGVGLTEGTLDADEELQWAKLETGFAELLKKDVLQVDFSLERSTPFAGITPEVELSLVLLPS